MTSSPRFPARAEFRYYRAMRSTRPEPPQRDIFSISRLNAEARQLLEGHFPLIWVEGEISNLARPSSGHWYFSLKDSQAQVRGAMFRNRNQMLRFAPENGLQVLVRARISLYEARGDYQLIVEHMEAAGDGALQRAFEALKQQLSSEGLFDEAHKLPLPDLPRCIGVITSPTGAAIRDILSVLKRRFPAIPVIIYPVAVQGQGAGAEIARALQKAGTRRECDVLLLSRGGGSLEDLWAFNEEGVARAIHTCPIPVVSGVGHEVDITIADYVADLRAATPSAAAEAVSPDQQEWLSYLQALDGRLLHILRQRQSQSRQQLQWLQKRLQQQHPGQRLRQQGQRLDELELRLRRTLQRQLKDATAHLRRLTRQCLIHNPQRHLLQHQQRIKALAQRLHQSQLQYLQRQGLALSGLARALDSVSPLATLERGYSITRHAHTGQVVTSAADLKPGEHLETRLRDGQVQSIVQQINLDNEP